MSAVKRFPAGHHPEMPGAPSPPDDSALYSLGLPEFLMIERPGPRSSLLGLRWGICTSFRRVGAVPNVSIYWERKEKNITMRHVTWSKSAALVGLALALCLVALPLSADEMWVHPGDKADQEVGNWGVTNNGEARFSFSIPEEIDQLTSARVVLLGKKTTGITWTADLSISRDGAARDAYTASGSGAESMTADVLTEVDVTSLFPAVLDGGLDMAGLAFEGDKNGDLYVIGLRIAYSRTNPLAGQGCADGELLTGYDASGDPVCVTYGDVLADVTCTGGQVLEGFDSNGDPVCVTGQQLLAGTICPAEQALQGFAADGTPICILVGSDSGGGGGGGGEPGGGGGGGGGAGATGWSIDDVEDIEGNAGTRTFVFTVTLSPADTVSQTIDYTTVDGTATAGSDYVATSGTLSFFPGQTTGTISVTVNGDTTEEPTETFSVVLSNSSGPAIADDTGAGTIVTDDLGGGR